MWISNSPLTLNLNPDIMTNNWIQEYLDSMYPDIPNNCSTPIVMDEYPYPDNFGTNITGSRVPGGEGQDHISLNSYQFTLSDGGDGTLNLDKTPVTMTETKNHLWKYNEDKILKDIQDYVTSTYGSHYCGHNLVYKDTQTIDLMAAKDLAAHFCQANILKYGSRYGDKDGRNKRDLLKVIHYAMLLLHFDGHYSRQDNGLTEFR